MPLEEIYECSKWGCTKLEILTPKQLYFQVCQEENRKFRNSSKYLIVKKEIIANKLFYIGTSYIIQHFFILLSSPTFQCYLKSNLSTKQKNVYLKSMNIDYVQGTVYYKRLKVVNFFYYNNF